MDSNKTKGASRLELGATNARGPFGLDQLSDLLTRRQASRVRVRVTRQHSPALGRRDRSSATDAQGPFKLGQLSGLLARRQTGRVRVTRQDGPAPGRRHRSGSTDARGPFELSLLSCLLTRWQGTAGFICGK